MKNWQFFMLMWILSMIAYYGQDKESILPLVASGVFLVISMISMILQRMPKE